MSQIFRSILREIQQFAWLSDHHHEPIESLPHNIMITMIVTSQKYEFVFVPTLEKPNAVDASCDRRLSLPNIRYTGTESRNDYYNNIFDIIITINWLL